MGNGAENAIVLYQADDGKVSVSVRFEDETFWLPQKAIAELFGVQVPAVAKHLKNIFEEGELERGATVSNLETVQAEGGRQVTRAIEKAGSLPPPALLMYHCGVCFWSPERTTESLG